MQRYHYFILMSQLKETRRLMVENFGHPKHHTYRTLYRILQEEIKELTIVGTVSA